MTGVNRSYWELTDFQSVELTDITSATKLLSFNSTSHRLVNSGGQRPLTPVNFLKI